MNDNVIQLKPKKPTINRNIKDLTRLIAIMFYFALGFGLYMIIWWIING
jgi:predicted secreted protein